jgi:hypothetical protein
LDALRRTLVGGGLQQTAAKVGCQEQQRLDKMMKTNYL